MCGPKPRLLVKYSYLYKLLYKRLVFEYISLQDIRRCQICICIFWCIPILMIVMHTCIQSQSWYEIKISVTCLTSYETNVRNKIARRTSEPIDIYMRPWLNGNQICFYCTYSKWPTTASTISMMIPELRPFIVHVVNGICIREVIGKQTVNRCLNFFLII